MDLPLIVRSARARVDDREGHVVLTFARELPSSARRKVAVAMQSLLGGNVTLAWIGDGNGELVLMPCDGTVKLTRLKALALQRLNQPTGVPGRHPRKPAPRRPVGRALLKNPVLLHRRSGYVVLG